jgi:tRNA U55 pseudouridine synthase TruB
LRRTASSGFSLQDAVALTTFEASTAEGLADRHIRPMASAMTDTPFLEADEELVAQIRHGKPISKTVKGSAAARAGGPIRVLTKDRRLVAVLLDTADTDHFQYGCVLTG